MNPLNIPWGPKRPPPKPKGTPVPNFIGVKNEAVRDDAGAEQKITVEVRGIRGHQNRSFKLAYSDGASLGGYLARLKLKRAATYSAVRDLRNPEAGRLRLSYVPRPGSHIVLGSADVSSAMQYQRTNIDAQHVALNMGRENRSGPSPKVVEVPLRRR